MIQTVPFDPTPLVAGVVWIAGLALLALGVAGAAAALYRWYARDRIPAGVAVLAGLAVVAVTLNTTAALGQVMGNKPGVLELDVALVNGVTFLAAVVATFVGRAAGDRLALAFVRSPATAEVDAEVSRLVRAVGRVITVTLPDDIEDIEGYDPVPAATKEAMAGRTFTFPRRLTVEELRERLIARLQEDYGVGHVGVELDADGTVEYLALGGRATGIGPTLAPGTGATAIRADPPYAASSGDLVQAWNDGTRVATAEFRAAAGDVVTLALDEADAESLSPDRRYRLLTMPTEPRLDREFASLLRAADETMGVVTVSEGSRLVGTPLGALDPTVVAVQPHGGSIEAIPSRERVLSTGDVVYAIARPESLRRLEAAAEPEPTS